MNCTNLEDIGDCKIDSLLIPNWYMSNNSSAGTMFQSVTVDSQTGNLYITKLPGQSPPLRFFPVVNPPIGAALSLHNDHQSGMLQFFLHLIQMRG